MPRDCNILVPDFVAAVSEIRVFALRPGLNGIQQDVGRHQIRRPDHFQQVLNR